MERVYTEGGWSGHRRHPIEPTLTKCSFPIYAVDAYNDGRPWDYLGNPPFSPARVRKLAQASICNRCSK